MLRTLALTLLLTGLAVADERCPLDREQRDLTAWPNCESSASSDPWLVAHHDRLRVMRPRVLVLNFCNDIDLAGVEDRTRRLIAALAESTRHHGWEDPEAPAFLQYDVLKYVDLRDPSPAPDRVARSSSLAPRVGHDFDYGALYSADFARRYGIDGLDLHALIRRGDVHELWFYLHHDDEGGALETIEDKQRYDEALRPLAGQHGWAGNGHSDTMPWSGRSFRITFLNPRRGIGCGMENFGHALEGLATSGAVPYFSRYFREYAELDLERRGLPFGSLYALGGDDRVEHEGDVMTIRRGGETHRVEGYVAVAGNVHFPPGARRHYDLDSPHVVKSRLARYRRFDGPDGQDLTIDFTCRMFDRWREPVSDGMGPWLVLWRQAMPGLDNRALDDARRPMKNWWPFLFY
jgi:hypothetical protein